MIIILWYIQGATLLCTGLKIFCRGHSLAPMATFGLKLYGNTLLDLNSISAKFQPKRPHRGRAVNSTSQNWILAFVKLPLKNGSE